ncbi:MAG: hypothetical protein Kow0068_20870 [Marinilabiliales bacterium]
MVRKIVISTAGISGIEAVNMLDINNLSVFEPEILKLLLQLLIAIATIVKLYIDRKKK